jgi:hypothetical protein
MVVGGAIAIAQPGDLGREDSAAPAQATTTSTTGATTTTIAITTTLPDDETIATVAGSGLSVSGAASGGSNGVAKTGGESLIVPGMGLLGLGLLVRRATRVRPT